MRLKSQRDVVKSGTEEPAEEVMDISSVESVAADSNQPSAQQADFTMGNLGHPSLLHSYKQLLKLISRSFL